MTMILIEGPDGVGKTVLARRLTDMYAMNPVRHLTSRDRDKPVREYLTEAVAYRGVYDRLHLSEAVYGTVLRGVSSLNHEDMRVITAAIRATGGLVVVVLPTEVDYVRMLAASRVSRPNVVDERTLSLDDLLRVRDAYEALVGEHADVVLRPSPCTSGEWHGWSDDDLETVDRAREARRRVATVLDTPWFTVNHEAMDAYNAMEVAS